MPGGFAVLGVGASVCGTAAVALLLWILGTADRIGPAFGFLITISATYTALAMVAGTVLSTWLQRRARRWLATPDPDEAQARQAMRLPASMALVSASLWGIGTVGIFVVAAPVAQVMEAAHIALAVALGGMSTTGILYLLIERVTRPALARALEILPRPGSPRLTVLTRLVLVWMLASGLPLVYVVLVLALPAATDSQRMQGALYIAGVGLVTGWIASVQLARAVAFPLRRVRKVLGEITGGRTDVTVRVDDASEIGLVQTAVNDMVRGLRERQRLEDLFGRHVGTDVAAHALEVGASLSGDVRETTALFVDVVDSTALADRLPPQDVVHMLNRFFSVVVEAAERHGGLVNKFVGDAALCVFGAPVPLEQPQVAALRAAREIRDSVRGLGELDLGIGIATGAAFAGQLGARSRFEYTVIGDPVNEAARLTEHAKHVAGRILAASSVIDAADGEREHWTPHTEIRLRGRQHPTRTWVDHGPARPTESEPDARSRTAET